MIDDNIHDIDLCRTYYDAFRYMHKNKYVDFIHSLYDSIYFVIINETKPDFVKSELIANGQEEYWETLKSKLNQNNTKYAVSDAICKSFKTDGNLRDEKIWCIGNEYSIILNRKEHSEDAFETGFVWALHFKDIMEISDFLNYQLEHNFQADKEQMNLYLTALIFKYRKDDFLESNKVESINFWITNSNQNDVAKLSKKPFMEKLDNLTITQKAHIFQFVFYYQIDGRIPKIKQITKALSFVFGDKYYKGNKWEKSISNSNYREGKANPEKDINVILDFIRSSEFKDYESSFMDYANTYMMIRKKGKYPNATK